MINDTGVSDCCLMVVFLELSHMKLGSKSQILASFKGLLSLSSGKFYLISDFLNMSIWFHVSNTENDFVYVGWDNFNVKLISICRYMRFSICAEAGFHISLTHQFNSDIMFCELNVVRRTIWYKSIF